MRQQRGGCQLLINAEATAILIDDSVILLTRGGVKMSKIGYNVNTPYCTNETYLLGCSFAIYYTTPLLNLLLLNSIL